MEEGMNAVEKGKKDQVYSSNLFKRAAVLLMMAEPS
jgi:hypothetical protein